MNRAPLGSRELEYRRGEFRSSKTGNRRWRLELSPFGARLFSPDLRSLGAAIATLANVWRGGRAFLELTTKNIRRSDCVPTTRTRAQALVRAVGVLETLVRDTVRRDRSAARL